MADYDKDHGGSTGGHFFAPLENTEPVEVGTTTAPEGEGVQRAPAAPISGNTRRLR